MRSGVGFSSFHTAYWVWYVADFVPAVNASPVTTIHIDPTLGWAGLGFAVAIQGVFLLYPKRLVSTLALRRRRQPPAPGDGTARRRRDAGTAAQPEAAVADLVVYTHTLPFVRPSSVPSAVVPAGDLRLDPASPEVRDAVLGPDGAGDLSAHRGVLAMVGRRWPPYLLDIRDASNVPHPDVLLSALLVPEQLPSVVADLERSGGIGSSSSRHFLSKHRPGKPQLQQQQLRGKAASQRSQRPKRTSGGGTGEDSSSKLKRIVSHRR
jgi:hypothetical protein